MFSSKIFFFNLKLGKYSRGKQILIWLPFVVVFAVVNGVYLTSNYFNSSFYLIGLFFLSSVYAYFFRYVNWFSRWDKHEVRLRIGNTRIDFDPRIITSIDVKQGQIELVRGNRLDIIDFKGVHFIYQKRLLLEIQQICNDLNNEIKIDLRTVA